MTDVVPNRGAARGEPGPGPDAKLRFLKSPLSHPDLKLALECEMAGAPWIGPRLIAGCAAGHRACAPAGEEPKLESESSENRSMFTASRKSGTGRRRIHR